MADSSSGSSLPVVELKTDGTPSATAHLQISLGGQHLRLAITVPAEPVPLRTVLPVLRGLTNAAVGVAEGKEEECGRSISCSAGCGACCRQLVPISPSEAHAISELVDHMPPSRREIVLERFAAAIDRLATVGMLESLQNPHAELDEDQVASEYFRLGIACPFLEEESCSIHPERPLVCREYLVTSPAVECSRPDSNNIRCVPLSAQTSWALRAVDWDSLPIKSGWVPMVLALEWAASNPEPEKQTGPQWIQHYFKRLGDSARNTS